MNVSVLLKSLRVAKTLFDQNFRQKVGTAGSALTEYAAAELQYTSAVARSAVVRLVEIAAGSILVLALLFGWIGASVMATIIVVPQLFSLSTGAVFGFVTIGLAIVTGVLIWHLKRRLEALRELMIEYGAHIRAPDAPETKH